jgi:two-component system, CAI-1 autoinducer sensor kinase/phosphatase CqsS
VNVHQDFTFLGSHALMIFVISNLIKNALYAMKVAEKGAIEIGINKMDQSGVLTVTDTATGISKSVIKKIFDTYYSTKQSAGAGVGLAFCLRVVRAMGGRIRCESEEGQFTTFTISLPPRTAAAPAQHWQESSPAP